MSGEKLSAISVGRGVVRVIGTDGAVFDLSTDEAVSLALQLRMEARKSQKWAHSLPMRPEPVQPMLLQLPSLPTSSGKA